MITIIKKFSCVYTQCVEYSNDPENPVCSIEPEFEAKLESDVPDFRCMNYKEKE